MLRWLTYSWLPFWAEYWNSSVLFSLMRINSCQVHGIFNEPDTYRRLLFPLFSPVWPFKLLSKYLFHAKSKARYIANLVLDIFNKNTSCIFIKCSRGVCFSKLTKITLSIILTSTFGDKTASWTGKLLSSVSNKNGLSPKRSFSVVIWKLESFDFHVKNSDLDFLPNLACNLNKNSGNLWISNTIQWARNLTSSFFGNAL